MVAIFINSIIKDMATIKYLGQSISDEEMEKTIKIIMEDSPINLNITICVIDAAPNVGYNFIKVPKNIVDNSFYINYFEVLLFPEYWSNQMIYVNNKICLFKF